ncbi:cobalamin biosynthesis protein CbiG [Marinomonas spartinae]|uniref:Cobalamin biosynthesis protein CbiG n=1 Tax=Marinomonas spartinae TaxID=1792290 RepID=A0A1A8TT25_9GAMM|nr:cobalamin biosynthesis protein [Marinomonas spartinae]SBS37526.1 cobalamin biosynthesis protein CbiG [Marinomonas spartinae]SBS38820.1 cobalamin biosynthesis protein CbiG [Marinomonas spartinae]
MIRVIALTPAGKELAQRLRTFWPDSALDYKPKPFAEQVQRAFEQGESLIFICATGIVMRTLAPVIQNKRQDPPVLVLDEEGKFVIPLLSGHEGGANEWGSQVAQTLGAQLVVTTAKPYLNPVYTLGMGCERGCPLAFLESLMLEALDQNDLTPSDINSLSSIDIKADEVNLIALAEKYDWVFHTFSADQLSTMEAFLSSRSEYVYNTVGVYGVAESAALFAAHNVTGSEPELMLNKIKNAKATCAIGRSFP